MEFQEWKSNKDLVKRGEREVIEEVKRRGYVCVNTTETQVVSLPLFCT